MTVRKMVPILSKNKLLLLLLLLLLEFVASEAAEAAAAAVVFVAEFLSSELLLFEVKVDIALVLNVNDKGNDGMMLELLLTAAADKSQ
jgi:hypothetical protein